MFLVCVEEVCFGKGQVRKSVEVVCNLSLMVSMTPVTLYVTLYKNYLALIHTYIMVHLVKVRQKKETNDIYVKTFPISKYNKNGTMRWFRCIANDARIAGQVLCKNKFQTNF